MKKHLLSALSHVSRWERNRAEAQQISSESLHSWIHLLHSGGFPSFYSLKNKKKTTPSSSPTFFRQPPESIILSFSLHPNIPMQHRFSPTHTLHLLPTPNNQKQRASIHLPQTHFIHITMLSHPIELYITSINHSSPSTQTQTENSETNGKQWEEWVGVSNRGILDPDDKRVGFRGARGPSRGGRHGGCESQSLWRLSLLQRKRIKDWKRMEDRQWLKPVAVVSGKHGLAAVRGFGAVRGDEEEKATTVSHTGRRNEKGEDLGSWDLAGDASGGGWRRWRVSPATVCAMAAPCWSCGVQRWGGRSYQKRGSFNFN